MRQDILEVVEVADKICTTLDRIIQQDKAFAEQISLDLERYRNEMYIIKNYLF